MLLVYFYRNCHFPVSVSENPHTESVSKHFGSQLKFFPRGGNMNEVLQMSPWRFRFLWFQRLDGDVMSFCRCLMAPADFRGRCEDVWDVLKRFRDLLQVHLKLNPAERPLFKPARGVFFHSLSSLTWNEPFTFWLLVGQNSNIFLLYYEILYL